MYGVKLSWLELFPSPFCIVSSPVPKIVGQLFSESSNARAVFSAELGFEFSKIIPFCVPLRDLL